MTLMIDSRVLASIATFAGIVVGCSGSVSPLLPPPGNDGGNVSDAPVGDAGGSNYTLDDVCDRTASKVCALRAACCQSTGGYDEATCITREKEDCAKNVAEVRANTMTFAPALIDPCLAKVGPVIAACFFDLSKFESVAKTLNECRIFAGSLGEGVACERDAQCKPSADANAFASCNDQTKKCTTTRFLSAAANCELKDGLNALCGTGLYCDAPLVGPAKGTCKSALALGAECAPAMRPLECGLGAYCDGDTKKCTETRGGGEPCNNALQCDSLKCVRAGDAGTGTCAPQEPLAKARSCGR